MKPPFSLLPPSKKHTHKKKMRVLCICSLANSRKYSKNIRGDINNIKRPGNEMTEAVIRVVVPREAGLSMLARIIN